MVAHLIAPAASLPWLIEPSTPPEDHKGRAVGFRRTAQNDWMISETYQGEIAVAQRMLARYALGYDSRAELGQRYGFSPRHVQSVITGQTYYWFTRPVRLRLLKLGIGNARMNRDEVGQRKAQVRVAFERLAVLAADMLANWATYTNDQRAEVARDLWLLSGAWREEQQ